MPDCETDATIENWWSLRGAFAALLRFEELSDRARVFGAGFDRLLILALDGQVHFFAMNFGIFGRFDTKADLLALDLHHTNFDVVVDCYAFAQLTSQNQH